MPLPTPTKHDAYHQGGASQVQRNSVNLAVLARTIPSPQARDWRVGNSNRLKRGQLNLNDLLDGALNPEWVEWVMGWPRGWSDPWHPLPAAHYAAWRAAMQAGDWWATEPDVPRLLLNLKGRQVRLAALGNGQVPLCAAVAWMWLVGMGAELGVVADTAG